MSKSTRTVAGAGAGCDTTGVDCGSTAEESPESDDPEQPVTIKATTTRREEYCIDLTGKYFCIFIDWLSFSEMTKLSDYSSILIEFRLAKNRSYSRRQDGVITVGHTVLQAERQ